MSYHESPRKRSRKSTRPISLKQRLQADSSEDETNGHISRVSPIAHVSPSDSDTDSHSVKPSQKQDNTNRIKQPIMQENGASIARPKNKASQAVLCDTFATKSIHGLISDNPGSIDKYKSPGFQGPTGSCVELSSGTLPNGVRIKDEPLDTYESEGLGIDMSNLPNMPIYPGEDCDEVAAASAAADSYIQSRFKRNQQRQHDDTLESQKDPYQPAPGDILADVTSLDYSASRNAFADRVLDSFASKPRTPFVHQHTNNRTIVTLPKTSNLAIDSARLLTKCEVRGEKVISPQAPFTSEAVTSSSAANRQQSDVIANPFVPVKGL